MNIIFSEQKIKAIMVRCLVESHSTEIQTNICVSTEHMIVIICCSRIED